MVTDQDLVYLAGNSVYQSDFLPDDYIHNINGKEYRLVEKKQNVNPQYAVYQNVDTGEYILALNGTNVKELEDVLTDLQLADEGVPELHQKALDLFNRLNAKYNFSAVCGNSLGGSLANFISVNTGVRSVTINPAVLPNDPQTLAKPANNITNYIATGDPLNRVQIGVDIKNTQMKGNCITVPFGFMNFTMEEALASHVGYNVDEFGVSRIKMGEGKVDILVDVSKNIVTNPFTQKPIGETSSDFEIEINSDNIEIIKREVQLIKEECLESHKYITQVKQVCDEYKTTRSFEIREQDLVKFIDKLFEFDLGFITVKDVLSNPINNVSTELIYNLVSVLKRAVDNDIIDAIDPIVFQIITDVAFLMGALPKVFNDVIEVIDLFKDKMFYDLDSDKYDQFVEKLDIASDVINENATIFDKKVEVLESQVNTIHQSLLSFDQEMEKGINNYSIDNVTLPQVEESNKQQFVDLSSDIINVIRNYENLIDNNYNKIVNSHEVETAGKAIGECLDALISLLRMGVGPITDLRDSLSSSRALQFQWTKSAVQILDNIISFYNNYVPGLYLAFLKLNNLKNVLVEIGPYVKSFVFLNSSYEDVILYYQTAGNSYKSNSSMLREIYISIDQNKNKTINAIYENMVDMSQFLKQLNHQIDLTVVTN